MAAAFWPYDARTASCVKCQCSNKTQTNKQEDSSPRRAVGRTAPIDGTRVYFEWTCAANMVEINTPAPADDNLRLQSYRWWLLLCKDSFISLPLLGTSPLPDLGRSTPSRRDRATGPCSFSTFAHVTRRAYATSCNSISLSSHDWSQSEESPPDDEVTPPNFKLHPSAAMPAAKSLTGRFYVQSSSRRRYI
jgi:hypothetical protein